MKRKKIFGWGLICTLAILIILGIYFYRNAHLYNTIDVSELPASSIIELKAEKYFELPVYTQKGSALTPTGISYNKTDNCFYIGNYGKGSKKDVEFCPSIEKVNLDFRNLSDEIFLSDNNIDVQGIAYDEKTDSIWYANGSNIVNYSIDEKKEIESFSLGKFGRYKANGICIDIYDESLWILCMYKYLLHYSKDGNLIKAYDCDYIGQDHICMDENGQIYISVGIDYHKNNNFVLSFNKNLNLESIYRVCDSYAIEGIVVINSKLYVVNDGIYHEAKINTNYIQEYMLHKGENE